MNEKQKVVAGLKVLSKQLVASEPNPVFFDESENIKKTIDKIKSVLKQLDQWDRYYRSPEGRKTYDMKEALEDNNKWRKMFQNLLVKLNEALDLCSDLENKYN